MVKYKLISKDGTEVIFTDYSKLENARREKNKHPKNAYHIYKFVE